MALEPESNDCFSTLRLREARRPLTTHNFGLVCTTLADRRTYRFRLRFVL